MEWFAFMKADMEADSAKVEEVHLKSSSARILSIPIPIHPIIQEGVVRCPKRVKRSSKTYHISIGQLKYTRESSPELIPLHRSWPEAIAVRFSLLSQIPS